MSEKALVNLYFIICSYRECKKLNTVKDEMNQLEMNMLRINGVDLDPFSQRTVQFTTQGTKNTERPEFVS